MENYELTAKYNRHSELFATNSSLDTSMTYSRYRPIHLLAYIATPANSQSGAPWIILI